MDIGWEKDTPLSNFAEGLGPSSRKHTSFTKQGPNILQSLLGGYNIGITMRINKKNTHFDTIIQ
jgi:hypothetical protein